MCRLRPRPQFETSQKGYLLLGAIILISILFLSGVTLAKIGLTHYQLSRSRLESLRTFYLAEAGVEKAKIILSQRPGWFTDLPRKSADDIIWLMKDSVGHAPPAGESLASGSFKIVREKDRSFFYSVGWTGNNLREAGARSIIRIDFQPTPWKLKYWQLL